MAQLMAKADLLERNPKQGPVSVTTMANNVALCSDKYGTITGRFKIQNQSNSFLAYRWSCTHPQEFTMNPCARGLVSPRDGQFFDLHYLGNEAKMGYTHPIMVLEITYVKSSVIERTKLIATTIWKGSVETDITEIRLPVFVTDASCSNTVKELFKIYAEVESKNPIERFKNVVDRARQENVELIAFVFIGMLFSFGFMFGYFFNPKCTCPPCPNTERNF